MYEGVTRPSSQANNMCALPTMRCMHICTWTCMTAAITPACTIDLSGPDVHVLCPAGTSSRVRHLLLTRESALCLPFGVCLSSTQSSGLPPPAAPATLHLWALNPRIQAPAQAWRLARGWGRRSM